MRPNILYINSHDTGRYVQPYGHAVPTPTIQALAEEGVLFRQAFCAAPTCSPSRAALLTGCYPHQNGMIGLAHRGFRLHDPGRHLAHTLRKAGYFTALAGVQHVIEGDRVSELGYDVILAGDRQSAHSAAAEFFPDPGSRQPFYLEVGFPQTHRVFPKLGPEDRPQYCAPPAILPDTPETRLDFARFKASARMLDEKIKTVLDALDRNGLRDNTLVICTTDHGIAFPQMKCNLTDHGIGVMLIMRGPGVEVPGRAIDAMVSHIDIYPTLCELLEIDPPDWLEGVSLVPLLNGEDREVRKEVFAEVTYHAAYEPMRCIRTKRHKYIRRFDDRATPVLPNCDEGETRDLWLANGWKDRPVEQEQLFDLLFDPMERDNLAGDAKSQPILTDMRRQLQAFMVRTTDQLLRGPVSASSGARLNDPDDVSPNDPVFVVK